jgi:hypothetical protein
MAKVTTSPLITAIAQKTAGIVFQSCPGGIAVRTQKGKTQTKATSAQVYKENYRILATAWQTVLNQTDRNNWIATAATNPIKDVFNNDTVLNGWSFFLRINMPLLAAGHTLLVSPPSPLTVTTPTSFAASATASGLTIQIDTVAPAVAATEQIVVGVRPFQKPSWGRIPGRLPTIATSAVNPSFPFDFTSNYLKRFGLLPVGMSIGCTLHIVNSTNGVYSTRLYITFEVGP